MKNYIKRFTVVCLAILCFVGCDAATKNFARQELKGRGIKSFVAGHINFIYTENSGGMLSIGDGLPQKVKFYIFTIGVSFIVFILFLYTLLKKNLKSFIVFTMILFISGGAGNLIDRITNEGKVIDFVLIELFGLRTGVFNLADVYITAGIILLIGNEIFELLKRKPPAEILY